MKFKIILALLMMMAGVTTSFAADPVGKIVICGIFKTTQKELNETPETPSGKTRLVEPNLKVVAVTNRVPTERGICFGMLYEISNLDLKDGDFVEVKTVTKCPPMRKPDGTVCESFTSAEKLRVRGGKAGKFTGYTFDLDYEMVPGLWRTEIQLNGKTMVKQEFTVFQR